MNWGNIMEKTVNKPMNIYESSIYDEFLETLSLSNPSKKVYRGYIHKIAEWIRLNNYTTIGTTEIATEYLKWKKEQSSPKQANCRHRIMNEYCNWLVQKGKLSNNPWKNVDLNALGISNKDVKDYIREYRKAKKEAAKKVTNKEDEVKEEKTFTLSDVALLLIAIEDGDEEQIVNVLNK